MQWGALGFSRDQGYAPPTVPSLRLQPEEYLTSFRLRYATEERTMCSTSAIDV